MMLLATPIDAGASRAPIDLAWSAFAPELVLASTVMILLLLLVAGKLRIAVGLLTGLSVVVVGVLLTVLGDGGGMVLDSTGALAEQTGIKGDPVIGGIVIALGMAVMAIPVALAATSRLIGPWIAGAGTFAALATTMWQLREVLFSDAGIATPMLTAGGSVALDGIAVFTRLTVLITTLLVIPMGYGYLRDRNIGRDEFEPLLLLAATGMMALGAASDAITLFVSLELLSIALYVLAGLARRDRRSQEAAIKYFVMGAVASAILLYGLALLYVATGTLDLHEMAFRLQLAGTPYAIAGLGMALVTVGVGFKIAAVPFHLWTPDVYQGAPTNITAFMAAGTKAAGFALVLRLYLLTFQPLQDLWLPVVSIAAAATMLYGAVAAIVQHDVKRILAYSSVAHAGYALIGVVAGGDDGVSSTLWYLLTYAISTMAAFGVVVALERQRRGEVTLNTLRGLGKTSPILAGTFAAALLSLAGIPPTAGFVGKLAVFRAGVGAGFEWLVIIGVLSSVIAAFFYLRVIGAMFLEDPVAGAEELVPSEGLSLSLTLAGVAIIVLGVFPQFLLDLADRASQIAQ
jgi:NADH-quinone oxidoreductase subunit N